MNGQKPQAISTVALPLLISLTIIASAALIFPAAAQRIRRGRAPLTVLQSSRTLDDGASFKTALAASAKGGRHVFHLDAGGSVTALERGGQSVKRTPITAWDAEAIAADAEDNIYLAGRDSVLRVFDLEGRQLRRFPVPATRSLAVLSDGGVVVASPSRGKLLHLYSPAGRLLRSFGDIKVFNPDARENEFLNIGKVVVGPSDEIYYVSTYAPLPYAVRFDARGNLVDEFEIEGEAVAFQQGKARGFLAERTPDTVGGVTVISAATVEPSTGHLWVGMNGLSTTATLYEYDPSGAKLREYAFLHASQSGRRNITGVRDLGVDGISIRILSWGGALYDFGRGDVAKPDAPAVARAGARSVSSPRWSKFVNNFLPSSPAAATVPQTGCPPEQNYDCSADCPDGSNPTTVDCKAQISSRLTIGDKVIESTCNKKPIDPTPGSSSPGGCKQTVKFCNVEKADQPPVTGEITVEVNCNPVPLPTPTPTPTDGGGGCAGVQCPEGDQLEGYEHDPCACFSPVLVDVSGDGFRMTGAAGGVLFDLNADGAPERLSWTAAGTDDSWLALDRDGDGAISGGRELFGNFTEQPAPPAGAIRNGFLALAEFDKPERGGNSDGVIDGRDAVFTSLRLWRDLNHDGISKAGELYALPALGVAAIELDYRESKKADAFGNKFMFRARVWDEKKSRVGRWAWDVFLVSTW